MNIDTVKTAKLPRSTFSNFARYKYRSYFSRKKNPSDNGQFSSKPLQQSTCIDFLQVVSIDSSHIWYRLGFFFWSRNSFALIFSYEKLAFSQHFGGVKLVFVHITMIYAIISHSISHSNCKIVTEPPFRFHPRNLECFS